MSIGWLFPLFLTSPVSTQGDLERLMIAIRQVETGGHPDPTNALGDDGRSLGPYQITWAYWHDSGVPGRYEQVRYDAYARRVMVAYWKRYCPTALEQRDFETLARIHNGGAKGRRTHKTLKYWRKVQEALAP